MNKAYLIFGFFIHLGFIQGQPYQSIFSPDTTSWYVFECSNILGGTIVYYSFSDTLMDEQQYHKLYRDRVHSENEEFGSHSTLCGFVREDTILGKYWFQKVVEGEKKEVLFMDLGLDKGDSLTIVSDFRYMWTDSVVVDTVYYENDNKVVVIDKLHYNCYGEAKIRFIEGVGATNGFYMGEMNENPDPYTLLCKFNNETNFYSINDENFNNCYHDGFVDINDPGFGNSVKVYPNPSSGLIYIETENICSDLYYTVYNTSGQVISKGEFSKPHTHLKLKEEGLYLIKISNTDTYTVIRIFNSY
jgi:hypothetical protein